MNIFKHMIENLFVTATGIAALIHSTWSLGTLLSGKQPDPGSDLIGFLGWIIPALLIAFALDIGQIFTSAEIRNGDKRFVKYLTFAVFAIATYYLQWLYMAHHIPLLGLEAGIRPEWEYQVTLLRDMAIWIVPAFMPLSTALYTISQRQEVEAPKVDVKPESIEVLPFNVRWQQDDNLLPQHIEDDEQDTEPYAPIDANNANDTYHNLTCEHCGWETGPRIQEQSAKRSLATHQSRYCDVLNTEVVG